MLNEIAQSSKFRIFSCISTLFLYLGVFGGVFYSNPSINWCKCRGTHFTFLSTNSEQAQEELNPREFRSFGKNTSFEILFVIDI